MPALPWALLASVALANAPVGQSSQSDSIEVIGKAPPQIRREASDYIHQLGVANGNKPAGRWIDPVCPHAIGLRGEDAALVEEQVRSVAKSVGAPLAKGKCEANLLLVFTDDPKKLVHSVFAKVSPSSGSVAERNELQNGSSAVRWWYSSEARGRDGDAPGLLPPSLRIEAMGTGSSTLGGSIPGNDQTGSITQPDSSLVSTQIKRALTQATILVDVNAATGKSLRSVVDYAALVGLAEVRLGATAPNSILGLFGDEPSIGELTVTDYAFLKALYTMNLDRRAEQHRRVLIGQIIRERTSGKN